LDQIYVIVRKNAIGGEVDVASIVDDELGSRNHLTAASREHLADDLKENVPLLRGKRDFIVINVVIRDFGVLDAIIPRSEMIDQNPFGRMLHEGGDK
jgi:hypothetical protein